MRWPIGIGVGLAIVIVVDFVFIYVASDNAPQIERSYAETQER